MIDIVVLKSWLGKSIEEPAFVIWLAACGIDASTDIVLPDGEYTAYVERVFEGYCFVFTDEAMFFNLRNKPIGEGKLYFSGAFFYADGKDGYIGYKGDLPEGLNFSFNRAEILKLLGVSSAQRNRGDGSLISERWVFSNYSLSITYSKQEDKPDLISLFIPLPER